MRRLTDRVDNQLNEADSRLGQLSGELAQRQEMLEVALKALSEQVAQVESEAGVRAQSLSPIPQQQL
jgi:flagellar capping protein FliD